MHEDKKEARSLHLYCRLFVRQGPWFTLDELYGEYYVAARGGGGVVRGRSDADADSEADSDTDEEGGAREGGNLGGDE